MAASSDLRARGWTFTWFLTNGRTWPQNYACMQTSGASFMVAQEELAPGTGKQHIQGYAYFTNAVSFESMRKKFPGARVVCSGTSAESGHR